MDKLKLQMLAQVAADFSLRPVIWEWVECADPRMARPSNQCRRPIQALRMDLDGDYLDQLVGAVLKGAIDRQMEWAAAFVDGCYQVTVWRAKSIETQQTSHDEQLHIALLDALRKLQVVRGK